MSTQNIIVLWIGLLFPVLLPGQNYRSACEIRYEQARNLFEYGKLYAMLDTLQPCLSGLSVGRELHQKVLLLAAEAYQFTEQRAAAMDAYQHFLTNDPLAQVEFNSPELRYLADAFEVYPRWMIRVGGGVNLLTRPATYNQRTPDDSVRIVDERFRIDADDPLGWTVGAEAGWQIPNSDFYLNLGLGVSRLIYRYVGDYEVTSTESGAVTDQQFEFRERHFWAHVPLTVAYHTVSKESIVKRLFTPYVYAGMSVDFLHVNTIEFIDPTFTQGNMPTELPDISVGDMREGYNISLLAGLGGKMRLQDWFFFADLRYQRMLLNLADEEALRVVPELQEDFNYIDNDFGLNNLSFSLGIGKYFLRVKQN